MTEERREWTTKEAGRKGGETTRSRFGTEHYQKIGSMGGSKVRRMLERARQLEAEDARASNERR